MQLMPGTAEELGVQNPFDAASNVDGGARFLKQLLNRYGGDVPKALGAYNAGPARVDAAGGVPDVPETMDYIRQIPLCRLTDPRINTSPKKPRSSPISFVAFLQQAEDILDIAASGDASLQDVVIVMDRQGGMRMLDPTGWSLPALSAEFGATAVYKVEKRGDTVRVEGLNGVQRCLIQQESLPGFPTALPTSRYGRHGSDGSRDDAATAARSGQGLIERPLPASPEFVIAHRQYGAPLTGGDGSSVHHKLQGTDILEKIRPRDPQLHIGAIWGWIFSHETDRAAAQIHCMARTELQRAPQLVSKPQLHLVLVTAVNPAISVDDFSPAHMLTLQSSAVLAISNSPVRT